MKREMMCACVAFVLFVPLVTHSHDAQTAFSYAYYVSTNNPEVVINTIRSFAPQKKGYVRFFSKNRIDVRIPLAEVESLKRLLAELGYIVGENQSRDDVTMNLVALKTQLSSKQKLLSALEKISSIQLGEALQIEQQMYKVILEIDEIKGKIAYYNNRIELPEVMVFVTQSQAGSPKSGFYVPAPWILKLGIEQLMRDK